MPNCEGHCCIQLGAWGCCKSLAGSGQNRGGGPGGEGPGSTEDLAFYNIKNRLKNHFYIALCSLNTGLNSERQLILV